MNNEAYMILSAYWRIILHHFHQESYENKK